MRLNISPRLLIVVAISICHYYHASAQDYLIRIMSPNDKEIAILECENYYDFSNGFAAIKTDSLWSFYDEKGVAHFRNMQLIGAENFADNGLALVQTQSGYGFMNKAGKMIVPPIYSSGYGYDFSNLALVEKNNKWGVLDAQGKLIIPIEFDGIQSLGAGIAVLKENSYAFYTNAGKQITGFDYNGYGRANYDVVNISSDAGWSFLDKYGNVSSPQYYDEIGFYAEGRIGFIRNGKMGYVNSKGLEVIPPIYESGDEFSEGLAAVQKDGLWGYIDTTGAVVIPFTYTAAFKFYDGIAAIKIGEEWLSINKKNEIVAEAAATAADKKSTYIQVVGANETVTLVYPEYNFKVEKTWRAYGGEAINGKIYLLSNGKLIGEDVSFKNRKIVSGTFYKNDKSVAISVSEGVDMANLLSVIDKQIANVAEQEKLKAEQAAQLAAQQEIAQNNKAESGLSNSDIIGLYDTLLVKMKQEEDQFQYYLDLATEFDLDAATEEERIANKQKKIQPYVDLVNEIVQRIDFLLANDPKMYADLEKELNGFRAKVLRDLNWIQ